jgi:hypothetical protein
LKIALLLAFMLLQFIMSIGIAAETAGSREGFIVVKTLACRNWDFFMRLYDYLDKGDKRRFLIEAQKSIDSGSCSLFDSGETVYIVDVNVSSVKLRRKNETDEYWTGRQAIEHAPELAGPAGSK